jgi:hypothetical protein
MRSYSTHSSDATVHLQTIFDLKAAKVSLYIIELSYKQKLELQIKIYKLHTECGTPIVLLSLINSQVNKVTFC